MGLEIFDLIEIVIINDAGFADFIDSRGRQNLDSSVAIEFDAIPQNAHFGFIEENNGVGLRVIGRRSGLPFGLGNIAEITFASHGRQYRQTDSQRQTAYP